MTTPTPQHSTLRLVDRNHRNALMSTGPKTPMGKSVSAKNSTKHGLCANPANPMTEDAQAFDALLASLGDCLAPRDPVEAGLVHRIAVSLWRLQRLAQVDAAISTLAVTAVQPERREVQEWIDLIHRGWRVEHLPGDKPESLQVQFEEGWFRHKGAWLRRGRPDLHAMDVMRDDLCRVGAGILAMVKMLESLAARLRDVPVSFTPTDSEMLAWLLGESAERLPLGGHDGKHPDQQPWASLVDMAIGRARLREEGTPLPADMESLIETQLSSLRVQQMICESPQTATHRASRLTAAMLPDAATLDRLIRYETHADRSLHRALETLAKLRGATVETIRASLTRPGDSDACLESQGTRTQWSIPQNLVGGEIAERSQAVFLG